MSLICATLTWLRNHKSTKFESTLQAAGDAFKDEPGWVVDQLLRRKRDELARRWEDREKRLEAVRVKEKTLEDRGRKRRRIDDPASRKRVDDEEAEFLVDDWEDRDAGPQDALSGLSKESREVLERIGLGAPKKQDEDESILEEEIKVRSSSCWPDGIVTVLDLLHFKNAFAAVAVHHRASPSRVSLIFTQVSGQRPPDRAGKTATAFIPSETVHQPLCISPRICASHQ